MLKYFEQLTVDLMIPAILVGMLYAFIKFKLGKSCRIAFLAGGGLAIAASIFVAIQKNTNRDLKLPFWNGFTYVLLIVLVIASAVLILSMIVWLAVKKVRPVTRFLVTVAAVTVMIAAVVYSLPDVLAYPFNFDLQGNSVFSTDFLYRLIGVILGFLLDLIACLAAFKIFKPLSNALSVILIDLATFISAFSVLGRLIQLMLQLQIVRQTRDKALFSFLFPILQFVNNNKHSYRT